MVQVVVLDVPGLGQHPVEPVAHLVRGRARVRVTARPRARARARARARLKVGLRLRLRLRLTRVFRLPTAKPPLVKRPVPSSCLL